jgi:endogenous inhibitor of DNA gyrase (YacG/DUF329 family)
MSDDEKNPPSKPAIIKPFAAAGRGKPCPICGKPAQVETRPFCSKRCADLDLGRWLGEEYRIPAVEMDDADLEELEKAVQEQAQKGEKGA